jgi:hypothetical protein
MTDDRDKLDDGWWMTGTTDVGVDGDNEYDGLETHPKYVSLIFFFFIF